MRLAASCFAVVRRFDDDSEGGVDDPLSVVSGRTGRGCGGCTAFGRFIG